jgi:hypothetical protein
MNWFKNSLGSYRNAEDTRYVQKSPKGYFQVFVNSDGAWQAKGKAFARAEDAKAFAEDS